MKDVRKKMASIQYAVDELAKQWTASGVEAGDTILIHSNIKRILINMRRKGIKLLPEHVLQSFMNALGPDGTLILPLFNFEFPTSNFFDIRNTPSQMGALTEKGRLYPGSARTGHPIYSFSVIGAKSKLFESIDNVSGYGDDSPFALLHSLDGKIGSIDLEDQNSMTFYHYVEEMHKVPYRYFKHFEGTYIDGSGIESTKTYQLYVRDIQKGVLTHVNPAGELMWKQGLYKGDQPLIDSGLRTIKARDMFQFVSSLIESGLAKNMLFRYEDKK
jgi:aminoglycoside 3-N-acetyltransferase